jgi:hypothetical protein
VRYQRLQLPVWQRRLGVVNGSSSTNPRYEAAAQQSTTQRTMMNFEMQQFLATLIRNLGAETALATGDFPTVLGEIPQMDCTVQVVNDCARARYRDQYSYAHVVTPPSPNRAPKPHAMKICQGTTTTKKIPYSKRNGKRRQDATTLLSPPRQTKWGDGVPGHSPTEQLPSDSPLRRISDHDRSPAKPIRRLDLDKIPMPPTRCPFTPDQNGPMRKQMQASS